MRRRSAPPPQAEFSRSEWVVMNAIWKLTRSEPEVAVSEVLPAVREKLDWHVSTLKTTMERLARKGALESRLRGNTAFYRPIMAKDAAARGFLRNLLDTVLEGGLSPLVAYLADRKGLSEEDIGELEDLIRRRRGGKGR